MAGCVVRFDMARLWRRSWRRLAQEGPVISDEPDAPSVPGDPSSVDATAAPAEPASPADPTGSADPDTAVDPPADASQAAAQPLPPELDPRVVRAARRHDPAVRRRRRRWIAGGVAVGVVTTVIVGASLVTVPYYTVAPGSVRTTEPRISVEGAQAFDHQGDVSFTTVSFAPATALTAVLGWLDPSVEVLDEKLALGGQQPDENRKRNLQMMDTSKQTAQVVALRKLGYEVAATGSGAVVAFVKPDTPAAAVLEPGDVITAVDSTKVGLSEELINALGTRRPGDTVSLTVEPGSGGPAETREVQLVARDDGSDKAMLGIQAGTRDIQFDLPVDVRIDSGDVGGPSAGLAFTLGAIDKLSPNGITGGKKIATTGTIDLSGRVGPVGGVPQKAVAVRRAGAELFLVPRDEYEEAKKFAGDLTVVPVDTLDDALAALAEHGGDTTSLAQSSTPG